MNGYLTFGGKTYVGELSSNKDVGGELVFSTAYTGYEEALTDPSYAGQILVFAYPLIGNYGFDERRIESERVQPEAIVARQITSDVIEWLGDETPVIQNINTRDIVHQIRESGSMVAGLSAERCYSERLSNETDALSERGAIGASRGVQTLSRYNEQSEKTILFVDCGTKKSLLEQFVKRDVEVVQTPCLKPDEGIDMDTIDTIFISNGPGDPRKYTEVISFVEEYIGDIPISGVCLGQQIVALAAGGGISKLHHGHRGVNQPVINVDTNKVITTTQNHSYEVSSTGKLSVSHRNVNDDSPEGLKNENLRILTRQYHPEANPGPHDSFDFFDDVIELMEENVKASV
jgi:carbamoyl-phosphate synthase small subunit